MWESFTINCSESEEEEAELQCVTETGSALPAHKEVQRGRCHAVGQFNDHISSLEGQL